MKTLAQLQRALGASDQDVAEVAGVAPAFVAGLAALPVERVRVLADRPNRRRWSSMAIVLMGAALTERCGWDPSDDGQRMVRADGATYTLVDSVTGMATTPAGQRRLFRVPAGGTVTDCRLRTFIAAATWVQSLAPYDPQAEA